VLVQDVLGYEGKRVIVTGAAGGIGAATTALLVELGAEVHTIDVEKPAITGLASFSECDVCDPEQVDATVTRIGAYVHGLFNCATVDAEETRTVTEAVITKMLPGTAIVNVVAAGADPVFGGNADIRGNCVRTDGADPEAAAWVAVFLHSPRASTVRDTHIDS
jgi:NADPH:quinone reductase-like Zn-dependent oxidoreductase